MIRSRATTALLSAGLAVLFSFAVTATGSAATLAWSPPAKVGNRVLTGVSCPTVRFCAVASTNDVFTTTAPAGGSVRWAAHDADPSIGAVEPEAMFGISCASRALCAAVDSGVTGDNLIASTAPLARGGARWGRWVAPTPPPSPVGDEGTPITIACPSASLCVAGGESGNVDVSTNPTGGTDSWKVHEIDNAWYSCDAGSQAAYQACPAEIDAVSCPSARLCVATDTIGNVFTSSDPAGATSTWTAVKIADWTPMAQRFTDQLSCPSKSFCLLVHDRTGQVLTTQDPTGGASTWHSSFLGDRVVQAISCPSAKLCVAVDRNGSALTSANPTAAHPKWTRVRIDRTRTITDPPENPAADGLTGVTCPSVQLCIAVDAGGKALTAKPPAMARARR